MFVSNRIQPNLTGFLATINDIRLKRIRLKQDSTGSTFLARTINDIRVTNFVSNRIQPDLTTFLARTINDIRLTNFVSNRIQPDLTTFPACTINDIRLTNFVSNRIQPDLTTFLACTINDMHTSVLPTP